MPAGRITFKRDARRKTGRKFGVTAVDHENKAHTKSFYSQEDAEAYAQVLEQELAVDGPRALALPYTLRQEALLATRALAPLGITLLDAVRAHIATKQQNEKTATVEEMVDLFLMDKETNGASRGHLRTTRLQLERFADSFGKKTIGLMTYEEIQDWFNRMAVKPVTKLGYRRALNSLFIFATKRKYTMNNPIQDLNLPKPKEEPIEIFTVEEMKALLRHATPKVLPFLTLGALAGLRSAEIFRLDWSNIRWDQGTIEIAGAIAKTGQRRFAVISDNLAAWLRPIAKLSGPVIEPGHEKTFYREVYAVADKAGVNWKHNALRHSYASYRTAAIKDVAQVSWEMGNSPRIIFRHYRELVSSKEAEAFWKIYPEEPIFLALKVA